MSNYSKYGNNTTFPPENVFPSENVDYHDLGYNNASSKAEKVVPVVPMGDRNDDNVLHSLGLNSLGEKSQSESKSEKQPKQPKQPKEKINFGSFRHLGVPRISSPESSKRSLPPFLPKEQLSSQTTALNSQKTPQESSTPEPGNIQESINKLANNIEKSYYIKIENIPIITDILDKFTNYESPYKSSKIQQEHLIDCNNSAYVIEKAILDYEIIKESSCFLMHLYISMNNYYNKLDFTTIPDVKFNKSYYQQKYNFQLYFIYKLLGYKINKDIICCELLCEHIEKNPELNILLKKIIKKYKLVEDDTLYIEVWSFLQNIQLFIYDLLNKLPHQELIQKLIDEETSKLIEIDQLLTDTIKIKNGLEISKIELNKNNERESEIGLKYTESRYFAKSKTDQELAENINSKKNSTSRASNSWTTFAMKDKYVSNLASALDSMGFKDLSEYVSLNQYLKAYRYHIINVGSENYINIFVPINKLLNYSHLTDKTEIKLDDVKYALSKLKLENELTYSVIKENLEKDISFYIIKEEKAIVYLTKSFPNYNILQRMQNENANTKFKKIYDKPENFLSFQNAGSSGTSKNSSLSNTSLLNKLESFSVFLKEPKKDKLSSNIKFSIEDITKKEIFEYKTVESADYHLVVSGENKFNIIKKHLQTLILEDFKINDLKIGDIYIETVSFLNINNDICNEAFKGREVSSINKKFSFVQANSKTNSSSNNSIIDYTKRSDISYCGIEKQTSDIFNNPNQLISRFYSEANPFKVIIQHILDQLNETPYLSENDELKKLINDAIIMECLYIIDNMITKEKMTDIIGFMNNFDRMNNYVKIIEKIKISEEGSPINIALNAKKKSALEDEFISWFNSLCMLIEEGALLTDSVYKENFKVLIESSTNQKYYEIFKKMKDIEDILKKKVYEHTNRTEFSSLYNGESGRKLLYFLRKGMTETTGFCVYAITSIVYSDSAETIACKISQGVCTLGKPVGDFLYKSKKWVSQKLFGESLDIKLSSSDIPFAQYKSQYVTNVFLLYKDYMKDILKDSSIKDDLLRILDNNVLIFLEDDNVKFTEINKILYGSFVDDIVKQLTTENNPKSIEKLYISLNNMMQEYITYHKAFFSKNVSSKYNKAIDSKKDIIVYYKDMYDLITFIDPQPVSLREQIEDRSMLGAIAHDIKSSIGNGLWWISSSIGGLLFRQAKQKGQNAVNEVITHIVPISKK